MKKLYTVRLRPEERERLHELVHKGRVAAHKRRHAQVLLLVDQGEPGPGHPDRVAGERVEMHARTVEKIHQRCVLEGLDAALERRKRSRDRSRVPTPCARKQPLGRNAATPARPRLNGDSPPKMRASNFTAWIWQYQVEGTLGAVR